MTKLPFREYFMYKTENVTNDQLKRSPDDIEGRIILRGWLIDEAKYFGCMLQFITV